MMKKELTQQEKDIIIDIVMESFCIDMNANDFFAYACADSVEFQPLDLPWIVEIINGHGMRNGVDACMSYIRNTMPIKPYLTEGFMAALKDIEEMRPQVWSEDGYHRPKEEQEEWSRKWKEEMNRRKEERENG